MKVSIFVLLTALLDADLNFLVIATSRIPYFLLLWCGPEYAGL